MAEVVTGAHGATRSFPGRSRLTALAGIVYGYPSARRYASGRRSLEGMTLPRFLGIGAPKAGTTWLHHNLAVHPELFLPAEKELHYFSVSIHRGLGWYASRFEGATGRIPGEITPGYIALPEKRIRLVQDLIPHCRLILIMRNPIDRAWSHAVMKVARRAGQAIDTTADVDFEAHYRSAVSRRRGDYLAAIRRFQSVFGAEQLLVVSYDEIKEQPQALLGRVIEHIGASTDVDWSKFPYAEVIDRGLHGGQDVFGRTSTPPLPDRHRERLAEIYLPEIERLAEVYPDYAKRWIP